MDVLVRWDQDQTENVVRRGDLKVIGGGRLKVGSRVKMWWSPTSKWYTGVVVDKQTIQLSPGGEGTNDNICNDDDDDDDDDVPLASIRQQTQVDYLENDLLPQTSNHDDSLDVLSDAFMETDESILCEAADNLNSSSFLKSIIDTDERLHLQMDPPVSNSSFEHTVPKTTTTLPCEDEDAMELDDDNVQDPDYDPTSDDPAEDSEVDDHSCRPEDFSVEGEPRASLSKDLTQPSKTSKRKSVQQKRLRGEEYMSEKSGKVFNARTHLKQRCNSRYCSRNGFGCEILTEARRQDILTSYYSLPSLLEQRQWTARHIKSIPMKTSKPKSRKHRTIQYSLPVDDQRDTVVVCRTMFMNTVLITDRQINTVLKKVSPTGVLEPEGRGGRPECDKVRDTRIKTLVRDHIARFPRMESHYCRADSKVEYLSHELTLTKMHSMYNSESRQEDRVSMPYYFKILKTMNLKFGRPKKDLCGICETYRNGTEQEKQELQERYQAHTSEKEKVRSIMNQLKANPSMTHLVASFDLQQVIFLPRSNRCELFYKRRLSCYNFSIFDLKSKRSFCYVWNETVAKRGANEIGSHLARYLEVADSKGYESVHLFCDGCGGQNKNTIISTMLLNVIGKSVNLKEIVIYYFETNHGQSAGDSVHSVIERALNRVTELFVPSQLSTLIRMASDKPFTVEDVTTADIRDYKTVSSSIGLLRTRVAEDGKEIRWPDLKQVKVLKQAPFSLFVKDSHHQSEFSELCLPSRRYSDGGIVTKAYQTPPQISAEKLADLMSLCSGPCPVIRNPEHVSFYKSLCH